jgi:putative transposase
MDNPYHLFLKTANPIISQALHSLNASDANWFRTRYQLSGSIFQGRFTSLLVDADSYALVLSTYLHLHPL